MVREGLTDKMAFEQILFPTLSLIHMFNYLSIPSVCLGLILIDFTALKVVPTMDF